MDDSRSLVPAEIGHAAAFRAELRRFLARTEAATASAGLTPQRYDLLLAIKAAGGEATINQLCSHLQMRQSAVTELVKRAEEASLTVRTQSTLDRRRVLVTLTPEAETRLKRGFDALHDDRVGLAAALDGVALSIRATGPEGRPLLEPLFGVEPLLPPV